jgi:hypothetical protein
MQASNCQIYKSLGQFEYGEFYSQQNTDKRTDGLSVELGKFPEVPLIVANELPSMPEYKVTPCFSNEKIRRKFLRLNGKCHSVLVVLSKNK